jgi:putative flippase GtrA
MKDDMVARFIDPARLAALVRFLLVGFTGIAVNELVYVGMVDNLSVWFVVAAIVSTEASTTWNFLGNELWAFSGRKFAGAAWARYLMYAGMNNALLMARVPMLWLLSDFAHLNAAWSNLIALGALFAIRFLFSDGWIWRKKGEGSFGPAVDASGEVAAPYRYDIGGLLQLHSESELPELAYFRTSAVNPPDIRIRIRRVGLGPKTKVRLHRDGNRVTYREHLGVLGADFNLTFGHPIEIEASPLLALSRHVLYTNVVEALLRFILVSKGYVLLHSAGMEIDGLATLLSAQTDTGKTSTVINLVRERHYRFISDDMAIIDPAGKVLTFPKPMTLSYHTMTRAVDASTLGPKKRMQLQVQSRIHSKSGRSVGKGLGAMNVPIMSINSVLQIMVPPPKYHITKLLPAHIAPESPIANVFLMERGEPVQERVALEAAIDQLIENTDDAYGFPPFATLAPTLVIGGRDYQALRARERELLTQALSNANIWRLRVRGHEWNELLPRLIAEGNGNAPVGVTVGAEDREPVGIPIEPDATAPMGLPIETPELLSTADSGAIQVSAGLTYAPGVETDGLQPAASYMAAERRPESYDRRSRSGRGRDGGAGRGSGGSIRDGAPPRAGSAGLPAPGDSPSGGVSIAADTLAIDGLGGFGMTGALPQIPDVRAAVGGVVARIRADARTWAAMAAIMIAASFVRLWAIGSVGFNNDEAVYAGQGAALASDPTYSGLFAIFRAHPLLVQFLYSITFRLFGVNDITPRIVSVAFGLGAVGLAYATGSVLYGRRAGLIAAAILALMPYHVVVTRQALLDGPETTLYLASIYQLARYIRTDQSRWLYGAAFTTGLTVLAKETAVLIVPVAVAFLLLVPEVRIPLRRQLTAIGLFLIAFAPYPAAILIGRATGAAGSFVVWEILRQPNHTWTFYGEILPGAVSPLVFVAAAIGLLYSIRRGRWEDRLLFCWIAVPAAFFEIWPVKGYQYLLPIAPALAILAGLTFDRLLARLRVGEPSAADEDEAAAEAPYPGAEPAPAAPRRPLLRTLAVGASAVALIATVVSLAVPSVLAVDNTSISGSLAGTGGLPGGRDAGLWIRDNAPMNSQFLTEGPTLANIVEFYGQRRAYGLSVSPNPLRRNPAYDPIKNPDRALQLNQIQYIATDIWSAQRSPFFNALLHRYISRYHGVLVYQQYAQVKDATGAVSNQAVIQIYEVRP